MEIFAQICTVAFVFNLTKFINENRCEDAIKIYAALRSTVQAVLTPWTYKNGSRRNYGEVILDDVLRSQYRTSCVRGDTANTLNMPNTRTIPYMLGMSDSGKD